ncbi:hypothetical protein ACFLWY_04460 [Chloroflexota bacterium]
MELAKRYSAVTKVYRENPEDMQTIDDAFAVLNAPMTRQFYEGCRLLMQTVQKELGDSRFTRVEDKIWSDLWGWVSQRWQEPSEELINAIKAKYGHIIPSDSNKRTVNQTEPRSEEYVSSANIDSVMAAESFMREVKCQGCGKSDHTVRIVAFPYVISILVASFKRFESGMFCHRCRCIKSIKWAIVSLLFGWWSVWGFFWNIGALVDNFRGGKMPKESNEPLVARLAWANMALGRIAEAKATFKALWKLNPSKETFRIQQELAEKYPEVSPARIERFRWGYLSVVFAIIGIYAIAGMAIFGGTSATPTTPAQFTPVSPSPIQQTPTPNITPSQPLKSNKFNLSTQITTNKARLSELETQLDAIDSELNGYQSQMDAILSRYPSRQAPEPYYSQYNDLVRQFNSRLATYDSLLKNYEDLLDATNTLIDQYNLTR